MNILRILRNNWKKTTFFSAASYYGLNYSKEKYDVNELMRQYCEEAVKYGEATIDPVTPPKKVIVLLNPAADKRSAEKNYQKFCEPILQLAGYLVEVIQTDSAGHARRIFEHELIKLPDAIIVAGGDGTISETVTGLMRRSDQKSCPIGILPLGRTNEVVTKIFPNKQRKYVDEVKLMADTAIAVVRGNIDKKDLLKIQPIIEENNIETETPIEQPKPIYAMGSLQWGAFRDLQSLRDKYWYAGSLREYVAPLFNAGGNRLTWECKTKLVYSPPCSGCNNCRSKSDELNKKSKRWWSAFIPRFKLGHQNTEVDYSKIINENCKYEQEIEIKPCEIILESETEPNNNLSKLTIKTSDEINSAFEFISQSWNRTRTNEKDVKKILEGRSITLIPEVNVNKDVKEKFYYIDNEPFEVRPVNISILPKAINLYVLKS